MPMMPMPITPTMHNGQMITLARLVEYQMSQKLDEIQNGQNWACQFFSNDFGAKRLKETQNNQNWAFQFFKPFWCKKTGRNLEQPKLGIPNFSNHFGTKRLKVIQKV